MKTRTIGQCKNCKFLWKSDMSTKKICQNLRVPQTLQDVILSFGCWHWKEKLKNKLSSKISRSKV